MTATVNAVQATMRRVGFIARRLGNRGFGEAPRMTQAESEALFGDEHVRRYRETNGEVGHDWKKGSKILLLTTTGRKSGEPRTHPLIYGTDESETLAVVASKGGTPE